MEMITLGTFNCENLFGRYKFRKDKKPTEDGGFTINNLAFEIYCEEDKHLLRQLCSLNSRGDLRTPPPLQHAVSRPHRPT
jgi:hypothetical protein